MCIDLCFDLNVHGLTFKIFLVVKICYKNKASTRLFKFYDKLYFATRVVTVYEPDAYSLFSTCHASEQSYDTIMITAETAGLKTVARIAGIKSYSILPIWCSPESVMYYIVTAFCNGFHYSRVMHEIVEPTP